MYVLCPIDIIRGKIHIYPEDVSVDILGQHFMRHREWESFQGHVHGLVSRIFYFFRFYIERGIQYEQNEMKNESLSGIVSIYLKFPK